MTCERRQRQLPRRSGKPAIGVRIVLVESSLRLTVQAGMSDALWVWLLDSGWRVEPFRPDRRRYREIARTQVTRLIDCDPADRRKLLEQAIWDAELTPTLGNGSNG